MVFCRPSDMVERAEAERELGLAPGMLNILVTLGQGDEVREATARCLRLLRGRDGVLVAALSSAIEELGELGEGVVHLRSTYPMSRFYRAFDVAVAAAGYNAFHELVRFGVPSLFLPMRRETDDQGARARWVEREGMGRGLAGPASPDLEQALDAMLDQGERTRMAARLGELQIEDGAAEAARWLADLTRTERRPGPRRGRLARYVRDPVGSARAAGPVLRRAPRNLGAIAWQTITRRPPRTLVLALGLEAGRLERELPGVLARTPDLPARVLVVTDSLELAPLRRAGVAFEHVPAPGTPQALAGADDYDSFLRRRLSLILAERRRPRRFLALGEAGEAALAQLQTSI
jgi:hypothetical protein